MMRMVLAWGMWTPLMTEDPTWGDAPSLPLITVVSGKYTDTLPPVGTHKIEQIHKNKFKYYLLWVDDADIQSALNRSKITKNKQLHDKNKLKWILKLGSSAVDDRGAILLGSDGFLAVLWSQGFAMPCHWPISFTFSLRGGLYSWIVVICFYGLRNFCIFVVLLLVSELSHANSVPCPTIPFSWPVISNHIILCHTYPTMGQNRLFWLLKTSLIFQGISWDLDVNVLKHITMKIML